MTGVAQLLRDKYDIPATLYTVPGCGHIEIKAVSVFTGKIAKTFKSVSIQMYSNDWVLLGRLEIDNGRDFDRMKDNESLAEHCAKEIKGMVEL